MGKQVQRILALFVSFNLIFLSIPILPAPNAQALDLGDDTLQFDSASSTAEVDPNSADTSVGDSGTVDNGSIEPDGALSEATQDTEIDFSISLDFSGINLGGLGSTAPAPADASAIETAKNLVKEKLGLSDAEAVNLTVTGTRNSIGGSNIQVTHHQITYSAIQVTSAAVMTLTAESVAVITAAKDLKDNAIDISAMTLTSVTGPDAESKYELTFSADGSEFSYTLQSDGLLWGATMTIEIYPDGFGNKDIQKSYSLTAFEAQIRQNLVGNGVDLENIQIESSQEFLSFSARVGAFREGQESIIYRYMASGLSPSPMATLQSIEFNVNDQAIEIGVSSPTADLYAEAVRAATEHLVNEGNFDPNTGTLDVVGLSQLNHQPYGNEEESATYKITLSDGVKEWTYEVGRIDNEFVTVELLYDLDMGLEQQAINQLTELLGLDELQSGLISVQGPELTDNAVRFSLFSGGSYYDFQVVEDGNGVQGIVLIPEHQFAIEVINHLLEPNPIRGSLSIYSLGILSVDLDDDPNTIEIAESRSVNGSWRLIYHYDLDSDPENPRASAVSLLNSNGDMTIHFEPDSRELFSTSASTNQSINPYGLAKAVEYIHANHPEFNGRHTDIVLRGYEQSDFVSGSFGGQTFTNVVLDAGGVEFTLNYDLLAPIDPKIVSVLDRITTDVEARAITTLAEVLNISESSPDYSEISVAQIDATGELGSTYTITLKFYENNFELLFWNDIPYLTRQSLSAADAIRSLLAHKSFATAGGNTSFENIRVESNTEGVQDVFNVDLRETKDNGDIVLHHYRMDTRDVDGEFNFEREKKGITLLKANGISAKVNFSGAAERRVDDESIDADALVAAVNHMIETEGFIAGDFEFDIEDYRRKGAVQSSTQDYTFSLVNNSLADSTHTYQFDVHLVSGIYTIPGYFSTRNNLTGLTVLRLSNLLHLAIEQRNDIVVTDETDIANGIVDLELYGHEFSFENSELVPPAQRALINVLNDLHHRDRDLGHPPNHLGAYYTYPLEMFKLQEWRMIPGERNAPGPIEIDIRERKNGFPAGDIVYHYVVDLNPDANETDNPETYDNARLSAVTIMVSGRMIKINLESYSDMFSNYRNANGEVNANFNGVHTYSLYDAIYESIRAGNEIENEIYLESFEMTPVLRWDATGNNYPFRDVAIVFDTGEKLHNFNIKIWIGNDIGTYTLDSQNVIDSPYWTHIKSAARRVLASALSSDIQVSPAVGAVIQGIGRIDRTSLNNYRILLPTTHNEYELEGDYRSAADVEELDGAPEPELIDAHVEVASAVRYFVERKAALQGITTAAGIHDIHNQIQFFIDANEIHLTEHGQDPTFVTHHYVRAAGTFSAFSYNLNGTELNFVYDLDGSPMDPSGDPIDFNRIDFLAIEHAINTLLDPSNLDNRLQTLIDSGANPLSLNIANFIETNINGNTIFTFDLFQNNAIPSNRNMIYGFKMQKNGNLYEPATGLGSVLIYERLAKNVGWFIVKLNQMFGRNVEDRMIGIDVDTLTASALTLYGYRYILQGSGLNVQPNAESWAVIKMIQDFESRDIALGGALQLDQILGQNITTEIAGDVIHVDYIERRGSQLDAGSITYHYDTIRSGQEIRGLESVTFTLSNETELRVYLGDYDDPFSEFGNIGLCNGTIADSDEYCGLNIYALEAAALHLFNEAPQIDEGIDFEEELGDPKSVFLRRFTATEYQEGIPIEQMFNNIQFDSSKIVFTYDVERRNVTEYTIPDGGYFSQLSPEAETAVRTSINNLIENLAPIGDYVLDERSIEIDQLDIVKLDADGEVIDRISADYRWLRKSGARVYEVAFEIFENTYEFDAWFNVVAGTTNQLWEAQLVENSAAAVSSINDLVLSKGAPFENVRIESVRDVSGNAKEVNLVELRENGSMVYHYKSDVINGGFLNTITYRYEGREIKVNVAGLDRYMMEYAIHHLIDMDRFPVGSHELKITNHEVLPDQNAATFDLYNPTWIYGFKILNSGGAYQADPQVGTPLVFDHANNDIGWAKIQFAKWLNRPVEHRELDITNAFVTEPGALAFDDPYDTVLTFHGHDYRMLISTIQGSLQNAAMVSADRAALAGINHSLSDLESWGMRRGYEHMRIGSIAQRQGEGERGIFDIEISEITTLLDSLDALAETFGSFEPARVTAKYVIDSGDKDDIGSARVSAVKGARIQDYFINGGHINPWSRDVFFGNQENVNLYAIGRAVRDIIFRDNSAEATLFLDDFSETDWRWTFESTDEYKMYNVSLDSGEKLYQYRVIRSKRLADDLYSDGELVAVLDEGSDPQSPGVIASYRAVDALLELLGVSEDANAESYRANATFTVDRIATDRYRVNIKLYEYTYSFDVYPNKVTPTNKTDIVVRAVKDFADRIPFNNISIIRADESVNPAQILMRDARDGTEYFYEVSSGMARLAAVTFHQGEKSLHLILDEETSQQKLLILRHAVDDLMNNFETGAIPDFRYANFEMPLSNATSALYEFDIYNKDTLYGYQVSENWALDPPATYTSVLFEHANDQKGWSIVALAEALNLRMWRRPSIIKTDSFSIEGTLELYEHAYSFSEWSVNEEAWRIDTVLSPASLSVIHAINDIQVKHLDLGHGTPLQEIRVEAVTFDENAGVYLVEISEPRRSISGIDKIIYEYEADDVGNLLGLAALRFVEGADENPRSLRILTHDFSGILSEYEDALDEYFAVNVYALEQAALKLFENETLAFESDFHMHYYNHGSYTDLGLGSGTIQGIAFSIDDGATLYNFSMSRYDDAYHLIGPEAFTVQPSPARGIQDEATRILRDALDLIGSQASDIITYFKIAGSMDYRLSLELYKNTYHFDVTLLRDSSGAFTRRVQLAPASRAAITAINDYLNQALPKYGDDGWLTDPGWIGHFQDLESGETDEAYLIRIKEYLEKMKVVSANPNDNGQYLVDIQEQRTEIIRENWIPQRLTYHYVVAPSADGSMEVVEITGADFYFPIRKNRLGWRSLNPISVKVDFGFSGRSKINGYAIEAAVLAIAEKDEMQDKDELNLSISQFAEGEWRDFFELNGKFRNYYMEFDDQGKIEVAQMRELKSYYNVTLDAAFDWEVVLGKSLTDDVSTLTSLESGLAATDSQPELIFVSFNQSVAVDTKSCIQLQGNGIIDTCWGAEEVVIDQTPMYDGARVNTDEIFIMPDGWWVNMTFRIGTIGSAMWTHQLYDQSGEEMMYVITDGNEITDRVVQLRGDVLCLEKQGDKCVEYDYAVFHLVQGLNERGLRANIPSDGRFSEIRVLPEELQVITKSDPNIVFSFAPSATIEYGQRLAEPPYAFEVSEGFHLVSNKQWVQGHDVTWHTSWVNNDYIDNFGRVVDDDIYIAELHFNQDPNSPVVYLVDEDYPGESLIRIAEAEFNFSDEALTIPKPRTGAANAEIIALRDSEDSPYEVRLTYQREGAAILETYRVFEYPHLEALGKDSVVLKLVQRTWRFESVTNRPLIQQRFEYDSQGNKTRVETFYDEQGNYSFNIVQTRVNEELKVDHIQFSQLNGERVNFTGHVQSLGDENIQTLDLDLSPRSPNVHLTMNVLLSDADCQNCVDEQFEGGSISFEFEPNTMSATFDYTPPESEPEPVPAPETPPEPEPVPAPETTPEPLPGPTPLPEPAETILTTSTALSDQSFAANHVEFRGSTGVFGSGAFYLVDPENAANDRKIKLYNADGTFYRSSFDFDRQTDRYLNTFFDLGYFRDITYDEREGTVTVRVSTGDHGFEEDIGGYGVGIVEVTYGLAMSDDGIIFRQISSHIDIDIREQEILFHYEDGVGLQSIERRREGLQNNKEIRLTEYLHTSERLLEIRDTSGAVDVVEYNGRIFEPNVDNLPVVNDPLEHFLYFPFLNHIEGYVGRNRANSDDQHYGMRITLDILQDYISVRNTATGSYSTTRVDRVDISYEDGSAYQMPSEQPILAPVQAQEEQSTVQSRPSYTMTKEQLALSRLIESRISSSFLLLPTLNYSRSAILSLRSSLGSITSTTDSTKLNEWNHVTMKRICDERVFTFNCYSETTRHSIDAGFYLPQTGEEDRSNDLMQSFRETSYYRTSSHLLSRSSVTNLTYANRFRSTSTATVVQIDPAPNGGIKTMPLTYTNILSSTYTYLTSLKPTYSFSPPNSDSNIIGFGS